MLVIVLLIIILLCIIINYKNKILEGMIQTNIQSYWFESYSSSPWKCVLYKGVCPMCVNRYSYMFLAPESGKGRGGFIKYYNTKKDCDIDCNKKRDPYICPP